MHIYQSTCLHIFVYYSTHMDFHFSNQNQYDVSSGNHKIWGANSNFRFASELENRHVSKHSGSLLSGIAIFKFLIGCVWQSGHQLNDFQLWSHSIMQYELWSISKLTYYTNFMIYTYIYVCVLMNSSLTSTRLGPCMYVCMYVCMCICVCMYTWMHACMRSCYGIGISNGCGLWYVAYGVCHGMEWHGIAWHGISCNGFISHVTCPSNYADKYISMSKRNVWYWWTWTKLFWNNMTPGSAMTFLCQ